MLSPDTLSLAVGAVPCGPTLVGDGPAPSEAAPHGPVQMGRPTDEGMPNGPSIFAYLVFGLGGTSAEGITRPMKLIA
jgi:hypothetical protein